MTLVLSPSQAPGLASARPTDTRSHVAPAAVATDIGAATVALIANAVTQAMTSTNGTGKTVQTDVALRQPLLSMSEAAQQFVATVSTLQTVLSMAVGGNDPVQTEEGVAVRTTEAAAAALQMRGAGDNPVAPTSNPASNGVDADIGSRSAQGSIGFASSTIVNLLVLLRQLLQESRANDRRQSADATLMQRDTVALAGQMGVDATVKSLSGAITAGVMTMAIGAAGMQRQVNATKQRVGSLDRNQHQANLTSDNIHGRRAAIKSNATPTADLRPATGADSATTRPSGVQGDADANVRAMRAPVRDDTANPTVTAMRGAHDVSMEHANIAMYQGQLLNMAVQPISALGGASFEVAAAADRSEQMRLQNASETFKTVADGRESQARNSEEMNEATRQLVETLLRMIADVSSHIQTKI